MHAFVHDRIFHIGGAEGVLFDLIREKLPKQDDLTHAPLENKGNLDSIMNKVIDSSEQRKDLSEELGINIYTLFSDKTFVTIDEHKIPVITALPRWINNIFVRGSSLKNRDYNYFLIDEEAPQNNSQIQSFLFELKTLFWFFITKLVTLSSKLLALLLDYRNLIIFYPLLTKLLRNKIQKQQVSDISISSFAAVKNVIPPGKVQDTTITLYLHSPMQYIRENYDEYCEKMSGRQLFIFKPLAKYLRKRDKKPRHYDYILTNSFYTKQCALHYYFNKTKHVQFRNFEENNIHVQYPKIHQKILQTPVNKQTLDYYLYVGRLVKFIRETDLVIRLANEINIPLIIMGSGPDEQYLKEIAGDTITFIGQVTDIDEKIKIMSQARGLINLTKESCGIGTMEALSLGVPVFGFKGGATPEFVNDSNGILAESKEIDHLIEKFQEFLKKERKREEMKEKFLEKYSK